MDKDVQFGRMLKKLITQSGSTLTFADDAHFSDIVSAGSVVGKTITVHGSASNTGTLKAQRLVVFGRITNLGKIDVEVLEVHGDLHNSGEVVSPVIHVKGRVVDIGSIDGTISGFDAPESREERLRKNAKLVVSADHHGMFYTDVVCNEKDTFRFLVDTGAYSTVIDKETAQALGFDLVALPFDVKTSTANGIALNARISFSSLNVNGIFRENISGLIGCEGRQTNLLGMTFLQTLSSYRVSEGELMLFA